MKKNPHSTCKPFVSTSEEAIDGESFMVAIDCLFFREPYFRGGGATLFPHFIAGERFVSTTNTTMLRKGLM